MISPLLSAKSVPVEKENTNVMNSRWESKEEATGSPPKMRRLPPSPRGTPPEAAGWLRKLLPQNGEWPSPLFFANEANWPSPGSLSLLEPPCKNDPRRVSGEYIPSPDRRRTAAGKKRSLPFTEPSSPPEYTFDDHMLNKYLNDSP